MNHAIDVRRHVRRSLLSLAVAAAAISPLALAQAAAAAHPPRGDHHGLTDKSLQAIGATDDQRAKILSIQSQARVDLKALRQASGDARLQMAQALAAPTVDPAAAEAARQRMLAQVDAASQRRLQAQLMISAVLTPAQRQQLLSTYQRKSMTRG